MNPTLIGVIGVLIFSVGPTLYAYGAVLPPFQFLALVMVFGYLSITAIQFARGKDIIKVWKQPVHVYAFVFTGVAVYNLIYLIAIQYAEAFTATALNYLWPVLLAILSARFDGRKLDRYQLAALVFGALGVALIFYPLMQGKLGEGNFIFGSVLALCGALIWALYSANSKRFTYSSSFLAPVMLLSSLMFAGLHFAVEQTHALSLNLWVIVAITGLSLFCYVMWDIGMREGNRVLLTSFTYFTPLFATALLMVFGFLPPHPLIAAAAVLIILACIFTNAKSLLKFAQDIKSPKNDPAL